MRWKHNIKDRSLWHPWFAWYPVVVGSERVWLIKVKRRFYNMTWASYETEYRLID